MWSPFLRHLPAALRHARDHALVGQVSQADPAEPKLLVDRPWATAAVAARILAHAEALRFPGLLDQRLFRHSLGLPFRTRLCKRHPERTQEREALLVVGSCGR